VFSSTWPCQRGTEKVPWVSKAKAIAAEIAAEAKSGDVKSTDAEDGAAGMHELLPWESFAPAGDNIATPPGADEQLQSDAAPTEEQQQSEAKEVAAEMPEDVNITGAEDGAAAAEEQVLSQSLVPAGDGTSAAEQARSGTKESAGEAADEVRKNTRDILLRAVDDGSLRTMLATQMKSQGKRIPIAFAADAFSGIASKKGVAFAADAFKKGASADKYPVSRRYGLRMSESIIHKIREGLTEPRRIPKQQRLCGRCKPLEITQTANIWPDKKGHRDLKQSLQRVRDVVQGSIKPMRQEHWVMDLDDVQMPPLPEQSLLSQKPHPKFKAMKACDVFRLEIGIAQFKVKEPAIKDEIASLNVVEVDQTVKELIEDLDKSSLRMIVQKKPTERTFSDSLRLFKYLRKLSYFKDLKANMLATIGLSLQACRYDVGEVLYRRGQAFSGVFIVTRGKVSVDGLEAKDKDESPTRRRLFRQRSVVNDRVPSAEMSAKEAADNEEKHPANKVFGVSDLLQEIIWPAELFHQATAVVEEPAEAFFLPANKLLPLLEEESLQERLHALQEWIPATKRMSKDDLQQPAKVERSGLRPPIQRLFDVREYSRHHTLYAYGDRMEAKHAHLYVILAGVVQLRGRLQIQDDMTVGALLGEEALRTDPYYHTAVVMSEKVRVLWIRVDEYVTQFMGGKFRVSSTKQAQQATMTSSAGRAGKLWKNGLSLLKATGMGDSGVDGDDGPNAEDMEEILRSSQYGKMVKQVRAQVLKQDKELWDRFVDKEDSKTKNTEDITWPSSIAPKTVPNCIAPLDSLDVLSNSRERLQALDKSLREGWSPPRRGHPKSAEAISPSASESEPQGNRQPFVCRIEVAKQLQVTASRQLLDAATNSAKSEGGSEFADSMPRKSVSFRSRPSIRSVSSSTSAAGTPLASAQSSQTSSTSTWVPRHITVQEDAMESGMEPRPPLPGRTYTQSRRPRFAEDGSSSARSEQRPGALASAAQSILTSPRPGEQTLR